MNLKYRPVILVLGLILFGAVNVVAQSKDSSQPSPVDNVVFLVTEVLEERSDSIEQTNYWWHSPTEVSLTESDKVIFRALNQYGITPRMPQNTNISRIYRRPFLSTANAAALGSVLGARQVAVGSIRYQSLAPIHPIELYGTKATVTLDIVMAGNTKATPLFSFSLSRDYYAHNVDASLEGVQAAIGQAVGQLVARLLSTGPSGVGLHDGTKQIAFRNVGNQSVVDHLRRAMLEMEDVNVVQESWASEGILAFSINSDDDISDDFVDYIARVLENAEFESFRLRRNASPVSPQVVEFFVDPTLHQQF